MNTHTRSTRTDDTATAAERRYEKNVAALSGRLPAWRTTQRRRLLVQLNWGCLALMTAIAVAGYFWTPVLLAWIPMTVAICVVWTMLRTVTDMKDVAPARYLDEFETDTLLHARSRALSVVSAILFAMAVVLIFVSTLKIGDGHRLAYAAGGVAILTFFVAAVIPASAMAGTMDPDDPADR